MSWLALFRIALTALSTVAAAARAQGIKELADGVDAAIAQLEKVHSSPVTKAQLESLRG